MKKLFRIVAVAACILLCAFAVQSCSREQITVVSVEMDADCAKEILINTFNPADYRFTVLYSNGQSETVTLDETMLNTDDYVKLIKNEGTHKFTVSYSGLSFEYEIAVKRYTFNEARIAEQTVTYDGAYHSLEVVGDFPDNTRIEFIDRNSYKNAGTYLVTAVLTNDLYVSKTVSGYLVIERASYETAGIVFNDYTCTYDGTPKSIEAFNIPSGVAVTYTIGEEATNQKTNAGTYEVVAHFEPEMNYNDIMDLHAVLTIEKATFNMRSYQFANKTVSYTGERTEMHITGEEELLAAGVSVTYEGLDAVNAGSYIITAKFDAGDNYNEIQSLYATLTIQPASIGLTGVYLDSQSLVYDGKEHIIEYSGTKPNAINLTGYLIYDENNTLIYDSNSNSESLRHMAVNAGVYTVYANFAYRDTKNYSPIAPLTATLEITKADITDIEINNETKEYIEGYGQSLSVRIGAEGVIAHPSIANPQKPGDYIITYTFELTPEAARNYNVPDPITRTLTITKRNLATRLSEGNFTFEFDDTVKNIEVNLSEQERTWIEPYFYTLQGSTETEFTGATEPGAYLVFVRYNVLDTAPENYQDYYAIPTSDCVYLIITKRNLILEDSMLTSRMMIYNGKTQSVTLISTQALIEKNPRLTDADITVSYTDNSASVISYYRGSLLVTLSENALLYYNVPESYAFAYAIRNETTKETVQALVLEKTFDYDGKEHSVKVNDMPDGITVEYDSKNKLTYPGRVNTIVTYHFDNEVAAWFYDVQGLNVTLENENFIMTVVLTVNKISYIPKISDENYIYDPALGNREMHALTSDSGVEITFEYEKEERVNVGTYKVRVVTRVVSEDLRRIYNDYNYMDTSFEIQKADYTYSFGGTSVKFDGEKHYITVTGLDTQKANGEVDWEISGDGQTEPGTYPVTVTFTNYSPNYKDISNQIIYLVINVTKVPCANMISTFENTEFFVAKQFGSLQSFLGTYIDKNAFDVIWKVDYFDSDGKATDPEDEVLHGISSEDDDFTFSEATTGNGYALLEIKLTMKPGYQCADESMETVYSTFLYIHVPEAVKVDISDFIAVLHDGADFNQYDSLAPCFNLLPDTVTFSYSARYMNGEVAYTAVPGVYTRVSGNMGDVPVFTCQYNTWGTRYLEVNLHLTVPSGYYIYDGAHSYLEYEKSVKVNVKPKDTVDLYPLTQESGNVTVKQYSYIEDYLNSIIDTDSIGYSYTVYVGGVQVGDGSSEFALNDSNKTYTAIVTFAPKSGMDFSDSANRKSYQKEFTFTVTYVPTFDIGSATAGVSQLRFTNPLSVYQGTRLVHDIIDEYITLPAGVAYYYQVTEVDGELTNYYSAKQEYILMQYLTDGGTRNNKVSVSIAFYPEDGNTLLRNGNNTYSAYYTWFEVTMLPGETVDISGLTSSVARFQNNTQICQYSSIGSILPELAALAENEKLKIEGTLSLYQYPTSGSMAPDLLNKVNLSKTSFDFLFNTATQTGSRAQYYMLSITIGFDSGCGCVFAGNSPFSYSFDVFNIRVSGITALSYQTKLNDLANNEQTVNLYDTLSNFTDSQSLTHMNLDYYWIDVVYASDKSLIKSEYYGSGTSAYTFGTVLPNNQLYRITLKFLFDSGYSVLDENGKYRDSYTLTSYAHITAENLVNVSYHASYTERSLATGAKMTDFIKAFYAAPDSLNIVGWKIKLNGSNGITTYVSGNMNSSYTFSFTGEIKNFTPHLELTYQAANGYILVDDNGKYAENSFEVIYPISFVILDTSKKISLTDLENFVADSNAYLTYGADIYDLCNLWYGNTGIYAYTYGMTYKPVGGTSFDVVNSDVFLYGTYRIEIELNASQYYYFGLNSQCQPITSKVYTFEKEVAYCYDLGNIDPANIHYNYNTFADYSTLILDFDEPHKSDGIQYAYRIATAIGTEIYQTTDKTTINTETTYGKLGTVDLLLYIHIYTNAQKDGHPIAFVEDSVLVNAAVCYTDCSTGYGILPALLK